MTLAAAFGITAFMIFLCGVLSILLNSKFWILAFIYGIASICIISLFFLQLNSLNIISFVSLLVMEMYCLAFVPCIIHIVNKKN